MPIPGSPCFAGFRRRSARIHYPRHAAFAVQPHRQIPRIRCKRWIVTRVTSVCDFFQVRSKLSGCLFAKEDPMKKPNSPMQLTRAADYAVRVMIVLAMPSVNGRTSLPALAKATDAPENFLSKVMQNLVRAHLVNSQRGQSGGFSITQRGRAASMREVIEAIDGAICLNVCLAAGRNCRRKPTCPAHPVWAKAQLAMLDVLAEASVAAMASHSSMALPDLPEPGDEPRRES
jgi:Rrf2 family protein